MYVMKNLAVFPMAAAVLAIFGASQAEAQLCANKSGQVYSRAQCKAKETVVPGTPGPIGPAGPQGQTGPQGPAGASAENTAPCDINSVSGYWTLEGWDSLKREIQGCQLIITDGGILDSRSLCTKATPAGGVQNLAILSYSIAPPNPGWFCDYQITMNLANGESWSYGGKLSSTRNTLNGLFSSSSNFAGTGVGTKAYLPVSTQSINELPDNRATYESHLNR